MTNNPLDLGDEKTKVQVEQPAAGWIELTPGYWADSMTLTRVVVADISEGQHKVKVRDSSNESLMVGGRFTDRNKAEAKAKELVQRIVKSRTEAS